MKVSKWFHTTSSYVPFEMQVCTTGALLIYIRNLLNNLNKTIFIVFLNTQQLQIILNIFNKRARPIQLV